jgi:hypothetical protein
MRADKERERVEGVTVPYRDAKRQVWLAMELLERERLRRPELRTAGWGRKRRCENARKPGSGGGYMGLAARQSIPASFRSSERLRCADEGRAPSEDL